MHKTGNMFPFLTILIVVMYKRSLKCLLISITILLQLFECFFSVLGSNVCDGRPSDTEELVRDDASSSYNNGAHINPGLASSSVSEVSHPPEAVEYLHQHVNEVKFEVCSLKRNFNVIQCNNI